MTSRIAYNSPNQSGALGLPYHYELLTDRRRLAPFRRAIGMAAPGKTVLESGGGSGILSILAARAGARVVYMSERDPRIARVAKDNILAAGFGNVVRILEGDVRDLWPADIDNELVDVVIAENLSTWQVTEPQISVMNHINRHLAKKAAVRLPELIFNRIELVRSHYRFENLVELRTHYFGFTGIPKPEILSRAALARRVDLRTTNPTSIAGSVRIMPTRTGIVNGVRLTSPLRVFGRIAFSSSDSLMPPVVVPLAEDLHVRKGQPVTIGFRYSGESDWALFRCEAMRAEDRDAEAWISDAAAR